MVRVANCPKCNHEAVIFDATDNDDWARCPECRTYFQIKTVAAREILPLVMPKDEALLAEEESAASVETVCSALETRWDDSRRTFSAASSKTIAEIESTMTSDQQNDDGDDLRDEDARELAGHEPADRAPANPSAPRHLTGTVADSSMLGTWSDLPSDESEAQARAVEAGDAPMDSGNAPADDEPLTGDVTGDAKEDQAKELDREFQFKETLPNFDPVALDDVDDIDRLNENVLDDIDDDSVPDESATDWEDPEEMVRLLTRAEDASDEADDIDEEPAGSDRSVDSIAAAATVTPPEIVPRRTQPHWAQNRRERSALRSIAMIAIAGLFGLALGYYALFWIAGPNADFLGIAQYLPGQILPAEFRTAASPAQQSESPGREPVPRAEVQASHEEPVNDQAALDSDADVQENVLPAGRSVPVTGDSMPNDVAASEPLELDPPAAAALADQSTATETATVLGAPSFTADELAAALQMAREAQPGLVDGDLDGSIEEKRAKGKSYAILCDLAQKTTFVDRQSHPDATPALDNEAQELFRTTLSNPQTREEIARIVPMWLQSSNRKHGGIFFAGALQTQAEKGSLIECEVDLGGQMLVVVVPKSRAGSLPLAAGPVAIVGWFVDRPAESVTGYTGQASQAVWAGHIVPLE